MTALIHQADALLRPRQAPLAFRGRALVAILLVCGITYGAMMGLFYGYDEFPRPLQLRVRSFCSPSIGPSTKRTPRWPRSTRSC